MTPQQYAKEAARTDLETYMDVGLRLWRDDSARLAHYMLGIGSEAGEVINAFKRYMAYGAPLDRDNLVEELGDLLWFISRTCDTLNISMSDVMAGNIAKLRARYPKKFDNRRAIHRNTKKEQAAVKRKKRK